MMNISSLPPEIQEEMRRVFPEEFIEEEVAFPIPIEPTRVQPLESYPIDQLTEIPTEPIPNNIEEVEYEEIVDEVITVVEAVESIPSIIEQGESLIERIEAEEQSIIDVTSVSIDLIEKPIENVNINYSRFKGADWFKIVQQQEVILAGLGGIGSYVNFGLSRLGPKAVYLFDDDRFESHNMSGQLVGRNNINQLKVEVAAQYANNFSNYHNVHVFSNKYIKGECLTSKVMICGFDNMKARKDYYLSWKDEMRNSTSPDRYHEYLFIDGRLLAEEFQILCITGDDIFSQAEYEKDFLFSDDEVTEVDCTLKQTSHMAMMIASKMVAYFVNFCNNLSPDNFPRRLPFYTHFNSLMNTYDFKY